MRVCKSADPCHIFEGSVDPQTVATHYTEQIYFQLLV